MCDCDEDPLAALAADFAARVRSTATCPEQCVLDVHNPQRILNLWQGAFTLIEDDLRRTLGPSGAVMAVSALQDAGIGAAFALRKELINLKKASLRLFHDAERVYTQLRRHDCFFFRDAEDGQVRDCAAPSAEAGGRERELAQYESICHWLQRAKALMTVANDQRDFAKFLCDLPRLPTSAEAVSSCHKRLLQLPGSLKAAKAVAQAERFLAESLAPAPSCVGAGDARARDDVDAPVEAPLEAAARAPVKAPLGVPFGAPAEAPVETPADGTTGQSRPWLCDGFNAAMARLQEQTQLWSPQVHDFIKLSVLARGGAKACSIRDGLAMYRAALQSTQDRIGRALDALHATRLVEQTRAALLSRDAADSDDGVHKHSGGAVKLRSGAHPNHLEFVWLSRRRLIGDKHTHYLSTIRRANEHYLRIISRLLTCHAARNGIGRSELAEASTEDSRCAGATARTTGPYGNGDGPVASASGIVTTPTTAAARAPAVEGCSSAAPTAATDAPTAAAREAAALNAADTRPSMIACGDGARLFVAGDALQRTMFYPAEFSAVVRMLGEAAAAARSLDARMRHEVALEGWPPPPSALRTRVDLNGDLRCGRCGHRSTKVWLTKGVCWQCDASLRAGGQCPYDLRQAAIAPGAPPSRSKLDGVEAHFGRTVCEHQGQCLVCDAGFSPCSTCRLARGDGETVAALCHSIVSTTPAPLDPCLVLFYDFDRSLATTKSGASPLQGGEHAVDTELAALAAQHAMHVVTRNSHSSDIAAFLQAKGVRCAGVHVVRKGRSKAEAMLDALPCLATASGPRAIFVDDTVRECCDERIAALPGVLYRVLFRRGAVV